MPKAQARSLRRCVEHERLHCDRAVDDVEARSRLALSDRKLLHIPLAATAKIDGRWSATMAFDSRGDQLAVAINDSLAFFNVSGGVSDSPRP